MGSTSISAPEQPSTADAVKAWVESMPQVYETQMKYAPLEAQQQVSLAQQYAQPLGEAYLSAQKAMYPEEYAMRSNLMQQATEGMQSQVPDWMRQQYLSDVRANLGTNAGSGIGADYTSRGLLQQNQDWQRYYQNMGMGLSGGQPTVQAQSPGYSNYMSGFTPQANMGFMAQNYGTAANIYGTQQQAASSGNPFFNAIAGLGGTALGGWMGGWNK